MVGTWPLKEEQCIGQLIGSVKPVKEEQCTMELLLTWRLSWTTHGHTWDDAITGKFHCKGEDLRPGSGVEGVRRTRCTTSIQEMAWRCMACLPLLPEHHAPAPSPAQQLSTNSGVGMSYLLPQLINEICFAITIVSQVFVHRHPREPVTKISTWKVEKYKKNPEVF